MSELRAVLSANTDYKINVPGTFWYIAKALAPITLKFDGRKSGERKQGMSGYFPRGFKDIILNSTVAQNVIIFVGNDQIVDNSPKHEAPSDLILNQNGSLATATGGVIATAYDERISVSIQVDPLQPAGIWVGDSTTTAADKGQYLDVASVIIFKTKAAIYGYNDSLSTVKYNVIHSTIENA